MLRNPKLITTGLSRKFNLIVLCLVHSPMLLFVQEICSFKYTAVQAHMLEARDPCYGVQFHVLSLLTSVIIEIQIWIWCHYYDYMWSLVWSVQKYVGQMFTSIIFHNYQHCNLNFNYKEKKKLTLNYNACNIPTAVYVNCKEMFTVLVTWPITFLKHSSTNLRSALYTIPQNQHNKTN